MLASAIAFRKTPSRCGSRALISLQRSAALHVSRAACIMHAPPLASGLHAMRPSKSWQEQRRFARRRRGAVPKPSPQRSAALHVMFRERLASCNASARALRYAMLHACTCDLQEHELLAVLLRACGKVRRGHERHVEIPVLSAKRPSRCGSFPCPQRFIVRLASGLRAIRSAVSCCHAR